MYGSADVGVYGSADVSTVAILETHSYGRGGGALTWHHNFSSNSVVTKKSHVQDLLFDL